MGLGRHTPTSSFSAAHASLMVDARVRSIVGLRCTTASASSSPSTYTPFIIPLLRTQSAKLIERQRRCIITKFPIQRSQPQPVRHIPMHSHCARTQSYAPYGCVLMRSCMCAVRLSNA